MHEGGNKLTLNPLGLIAPPWEVTRDAPGIEEYLGVVRGVVASQGLNGSSGSGSGRSDSPPAFGLQPSFANNTG